jgi:putative hemolysin
MAEPLFSYADPAFPWGKRSLIRLIERFTGQPRLKRLYLAHHDNPRPGESFFAAAVRSLELDVRLSGEALSTIPKTGPLVIVANHPYGVLDGIVITWLMETVRKDFKVLTNAVLLRAPEARDYLLPVDFSETPEALATNLATREAARRLLDAGGAVVVFPAGGVSTTIDKLGRGRAIDAPWQPFTAQLIQRSKAAVVPVFFAGQNSRLFQLASHIHMTLRLSLIFKEVRDRIGTVLPVTIGACISPEEIRKLGDRKALMEELRRRTYGLGGLSPYVDAPAADSLDWLRRLASHLPARRRPPAGEAAADPIGKVY